MGSENKPDEIWSIVWKINSYQEYLNKIVPELFINKNAPQQVKKGFDLAWKLLRQAYFEYEFIDLALTQSIITLERALRLKYDEVNVKSMKNLTLQELLRWFLANGYFEPTNPQLFDQLRLIRNGKVHDKEHSLGGIAFLNKVLTPVQLANDLFEDRELRIKRQEERKSLEQYFQKHLKYGGILYSGGRKLIVMRAVPIFINNKSIPRILSLAVLPIFDPAPFISGQGITYTPITLTISGYQPGRGDIVLSGVDSITGETVSITRITDEVNRDKFSSWLSLAQPVLQNPYLLNFAIDSAINDLYLSQRDQLHRIEGSY